MSESIRYALGRYVPSSDEVAGKISACRDFLRSNVNGAPLCEDGALKTAEDFSARFTACMSCYQATSHVLGLVGHPESSVKEAFSHIDGVFSACAALSGAYSDKLPPPVSKKG